MTLINIHLKPARNLVLLLLCTLPLYSHAANTTLWYEQPAGRWVEALPLGNGRMGAMVFGGIQNERLQLNEESLWAGNQFETYPDNFKENLKKLQDMVLDGKIAEANSFGLKRMVKKPTSFRSYEPLADLHLKFKHGKDVSEYRRDLDLLTGIASVQYKLDDILYKRETLISAVDDVMVTRISADQPGAISLTVSMTRAKDMQVSPAEDGVLRMDGQIVDIAKKDGGYEPNRGGSGPGGAHMKFAGRLVAKANGGTVASKGDTLVIEGADEAVLLFTAATDYNLEIMNFDRSIDPAKISADIMKKAAEKSWKKIRAHHVAEHRGIMGRVGLDLGKTENSALPTDKRLAALSQGGEDPGLFVLYFQYGRYLLAGGSRRPGRLPVNLQGIWNKDMWAAWESDYHLNINLQMNYWPADVGNLSDRNGSRIIKNESPSTGMSRT